MARQQGERPSPGERIVECADCQSKNQFQRHLHWLKMPTEMALVGHWRQQYTDDEWEALHQDGTITARIAWRRSVESNYRDVADEETGQKLLPWEAWVKSNQAAAAARERGETQPHG